MRPRADAESFAAVPIDEAERDHAAAAVVRASRERPAVDEEPVGEPFAPCLARTSIGLTDPRRTGSTALKGQYQIVSPTCGCR